MYNSTYEQKKYSNSENEILRVAREVLQIDLKRLPEHLVKDLLKVANLVIDLGKRILEGAKLEVLNILRALNGEYIEPGPSGSPFRGRVDIFPTGRNFYSFDPLRIPTPSAWRVGTELAEKLLERYLREHGRYPETVAIVEWCIDPFKSDGEGVAQILYLLGVRPVWNPESGIVMDVEPIPLEELGRPRIDVLVRVDGIFRDTTPNLMSLIDKAVKKVASLDEPPSKNYVRKHVLERLIELERRGLSGDSAFRTATYRVFTEKPGSYGAGVNYAIYASAWKTRRDLAEVWIEWSSYAYGEEGVPVKLPDQLRHLLKTVDLTFQKLETDEFDILDCCCFFAYHGGMHAAVETERDTKIPAYFGDSRDPERVTVKHMEDEIERVVRTRLLNPQWIEGKKRHGFRGAGEIAERVGRIYGWAATAGVVRDWIFEEIAKTFVLNDEMRRWFLDTNIHALEEIARRLLEAADRGVWKTSQDLLDRLRRVYSEIEAVLEGEIQEGEYQGGTIVVITREELRTEQST